MSLESSIFLFIQTPTHPNVSEALEAVGETGLFHARRLRFDDDVLPVLLEARPCVCVFSITGEVSYAHTMGALESLRALRMMRGLPVRDPALRIVLVAENRVPPVEKWHEVGVHELVIAPVLPRAFAFKLVRHFRKAFASEIASAAPELPMAVLPGLEPEPGSPAKLEKHASAGGVTRYLKPASYRNRIGGGGQAESKILETFSVALSVPELGDDASYWTSGPPDEKGEDTWIFTGPAPEAGGVGSSRRRWKYQGDRPRYDRKFKRWHFEGERPALSFEPTGERPPSPAENASFVISTSDDGNELAVLSALAAPGGDAGPEARAVGQIEYDDPVLNRYAVEGVDESDLQRVMGEMNLGTGPARDRSDEVPETSFDSLPSLERKKQIEAVLADIRRRAAAGGRAEGGAERETRTPWEPRRKGKRGELGDEGTRPAPKGLRESEPRAERAPAKEYGRGTREGGLRSGTQSKPDAGHARPEYEARQKAAPIEGEGTRRGVLGTRREADERERGLVPAKTSRGAPPSVREPGEARPPKEREALDDRRGPVAARPTREIRVHTSGPAPTAPDTEWSGARGQASEDAATRAHAVPASEKNSPFRNRVGPGEAQKDPSYNVKKTADKAATWSMQNYDEALERQDQAFDDFFTRRLMRARDAIAQLVEGPKKKEKPTREASSASHNSLRRSRGEAAAGGARNSARGGASQADRVGLLGRLKRLLKRLFTSAPK